MALVGACPKMKSQMVGARQVNTGTATLMALVGACPKMKSQMVGARQVNTGTATLMALVGACPKMKSRLVGALQVNTGTATLMALVGACPKVPWHSPKLTPATSASSCKCLLSLDSDLFFMERTSIIPSERLCAK